MLYIRIVDIMQAGTYWQVLGYFLIALGAILTALGGHFIGKGSKIREYRYESRTGKFSGKVLNDSHGFTINFGGNYTTLTGTRLKEGFDLSDISMINISSLKIPIKIYEENG
ncbi:MAG: hypothetical protein K8R68_00680, partial [Bacteroidales bacterium]|nr:hypothetical protein [Bacteroidales bacterium]